MRKLTFLLLLSGFLQSAFASSRVTVTELEQRLAAAHGKPDAEVAQQLSDLELTERLSTRSLARLESNSPGVKTTQELRILADQSAFLSLPAAEIPAIPAPDVATQRQIMGLVVNYISKTIHQLPNFYATRITTSFEETPQSQALAGAATIQYVPLHQTNTFNVTVLYRDGQEVVDDGKVRAKASKLQANGLSDWGVFGPILSTVILDAARSNLSWSHWEQGAAGTRAVFRYTVPLANSHYRVNYCCVPSLDPVNHLTVPFDRIVGYHGEIAIDPHSGSILRLTVEADLKSTDPVSTAGIMVEYAPVEIGGQTYICATRSVAYSIALSTSDFIGGGRHSFIATVTPGPPRKLLNDVAFQQYHLFRSDVSILTGDEAHQPEISPAAPPPASTNEVMQSPAATQESVHTGANPTPASDSRAADSSASAAPAPPPRLPATDARKESPTDQVPVFKTTTSEVVVDVVVTKGNGEPVLGLGKQNFEISENGKPQPIDFFEEHTKSSPKPAAPPDMPDMPAGTRTNLPPATSSDAVNVLLIDTLNTGMQDQAYVRREVLGFLAKMQPGTRMAIFALGSKLRCLQGITSDSSALLAALQDQQNGLKGEKSSFLKTRVDAANDAADVAKLQTMQTSPYAIAALQAALADAGARDFGARASITFEALMYLGHYLAGVPGRKNLIWFAGSFPLAIFPTEDQLAHLKQNPNLPGYVDRVKMTADLFTVSQISVYPISAEGLMMEHIGEADSAGPGGSGIKGNFGSHADSVMSPYNAGANDRASTISAMDQLAASTGGKAYYNTNDLNVAMRHAIDDGANYYTIGYSPSDTKMDGSYRQVAVQTDGKFKLSYRHGYNADDAPTPDAKSNIDPLAPLLQLGLPGATAVLYGVTAEPSATQPSPGEAYDGQNPNLKGPVTRYTVDFIIRSQDLVLKPNPQGGRSGKFLLALKAYDRDGNALNWVGDVETVDINPDQYDSLQKSGIPAHLNIDIPTTREIHLVTAVYDLDSGAAGAQEIPLHLISH